MRVPSKKKCRKAVNKLLKNHGVKVVNHHRWFNRRKKRLAKNLLIRRGLDILADRLEDTAVYIKCGNKRMILTPGNMWGGKMSKERRVHTLALFAHEMTHYEQAETYTFFLASYATDSNRRADWEVDACVAGADIYKAVGGFQVFIASDGVFDDAWAQMYRLTEKDVAFARAKYNRRLEAHKRGQSASTMGGELIALLAKD